VKRFFVVLSAVGVLSFVSLAVEAGDRSSGRGFWGLWEAIDPLDGSTQQISISDGAEGSFNLLWRESYWTICSGRRGVLNGTGELKPGKRKTLVVQMTITCFDPEEVVVEDSIEFEVEGQNMLLASDPGEFPALPFFRVSGRVRGGERSDD